MTMQQLLAEFHGPPELSRPVSERRVDLINALRRLGQPLIETLRTDLANAEPEVRIRALRVLMSLGNQARPLVPEVIAAANHDNAGVRAAAIPVLCQIRDPRAFDTLLQAANDPDQAARTAILRYGRRALSEAPFAVSVRALKDKNIHVRVAAVQELSMLKDKRAVAHLALVLEDQTVLHHDVRDGVTTTHRMCDEAVQGIEMLVNGVYMLPGKKNQKDYDALVQFWRGWWKSAGSSLRMRCMRSRK